MKELYTVSQHYWSKGSFVDESVRRGLWEVDTPHTVAIGLRGKLWVRSLVDSRVEGSIDAGVLIPVVQSFTHEDFKKSGHNREV